jgi:quinol monooxygenase YgiN
MAIAVMAEIPGGTLEQYDRVTAAMGEEPSPGLLVHFAGISDGRLFVVDVWESREAYEKHLAKVRSIEAVGEAVAALPPFTHREFEIHRLVLR